MQDPANLPHFVQNETLIGALSRILLEDRKRSTELTTNILEVFLCFSNFSQLQRILLDNKIGDTCMRAIALEMKRYDNKSTKKTPAFLCRQEKLLYVAFFVLLNLAEDPAIELKMRARGVVSLLLQSLRRTDTQSYWLHELYILAITFLKRLSVFRENKEDMADNDVMKALKPFLTFDNLDVRLAALRLAFNLSFEPEIRAEFSLCGLLPALVEAMQVSQDCRGRREDSLQYFLG
eukprot:35777_1